MIMDFCQKVSILLEAQCATDQAQKRLDEGSSCCPHLHYYHVFQIHNSNVGNLSSKQNT